MGKISKNPVRAAQKEQKKIARKEEEKKRKIEKKQELQSRDSLPLDVNAKTRNDSHISVQKRNEYCLDVNIKAQDDIAELGSKLRSYREKHPHFNMSSCLSPKQRAQQVFMRLDEATKIYHGFSGLVNRYQTEVIHLINKTIKASGEISREIQSEYKSIWRNHLNPIIAKIDLEVNVAMEKVSQAKSELLEYRSDNEQNFMHLIWRSNIPLYYLERHLKISTLQPDLLNGILFAKDRDGYTPFSFLLLSLHDFSADYDIGKQVVEYSHITTPPLEILLSTDKIESYLVWRKGGEIVANPKSNFVEMINGLNLFLVKNQNNNVTSQVRLISLLVPFYMLKMLYETSQERAKQANSLSIVEEIANGTFKHKLVAQNNVLPLVITDLGSRSSSHQAITNYSHVQQKTIEFPLGVMNVVQHSAQILAKQANSAIMQQRNIQEAKDAVMVKLQVDIDNANKQLMALVRRGEVGSRQFSEASQSVETLRNYAAHSILAHNAVLSGVMPATKKQNLKEDERFNQELEDTLSNHFRYLLDIGREFNGHYFFFKNVDENTTWYTSHLFFMLEYTYTWFMQQGETVNFDDPLKLDGQRRLMRVMLNCCVENGINLESVVVREISQMGVLQFHNNEKLLFQLLRLSGAMHETAIAFSRVGRNIDKTKALHSHDFVIESFSYFWDRLSEGKKADLINSKDCMGRSLASFALEYASEKLIAEILDKVTEFAQSKSVPTSIVIDMIKFHDPYSAGMPPLFVLVAKHKGTILKRLVQEFNISLFDEYIHQIGGRFCKWDILSYAICMIDDERSYHENKENILDIIRFLTDNHVEILNRDLVIDIIKSKYLVDTELPDLLGIKIARPKPTVKTVRSQTSNEASHGPDLSFLDLDSRLDVKVEKSAEKKKKPFHRDRKVSVSVHDDEVVDVKDFTAFESSIEELEILNLRKLLGFVLERDAAFDAKDNIKCLKYFLYQIGVHKAQISGDDVQAFLVIISTSRQVGLSAENYQKLLSSIFELKSEKIPDIIKYENIIVNKIQNSDEDFVKFIFSKYPNLVADKVIERIVPVIETVSPEMFSLLKEELNIFDEYRDLKGRDIEQLIKQLRPHDYKKFCAEESECKVDPVLEQSQDRATDTATVTLDSGATEIIDMPVIRQQEVEQDVSDDELNAEVMVSEGKNIPELNVEDSLAAKVETMLHNKYPNLKEFQARIMGVAWGEAKADIHYFGSEIYLAILENVSANKFNDLKRREANNLNVRIGLGSTHFSELDFSEIIHQMQKDYRIQGSVDEKKLGYLNMQFSAPDGSQYKVTFYDQSNTRLSNVGHTNLESLYLDCTDEKSSIKTTMNYMSADGVLDQIENGAFVLTSSTYKLAEKIFTGAIRYPEIFLIGNREMIGSSVINIIRGPYALPFMWEIQNQLDHQVLRDDERNFINHSHERVGLFQPFASNLSDPNIASSMSVMQL